MIACVSRKLKCVVLVDGRCAPFTNMYDQFGEETESLEKAATAVAEHPDGTGWFAVEIDDWDEPTVH